VDYFKHAQELYLAYVSWLFLSSLFPSGQVQDSVQTQLVSVVWVLDTTEWSPGHQSVWNDDGPAQLVY